MEYNEWRIEPRLSTIRAQDHIHNTDTKPVECE